MKTLELPHLCEQFTPTWSVGNAVKIAEHATGNPFQVQSFKIAESPFLSAVNPMMSKQGNLMYHKSENKVL